jgi:hypothetical protein
MGPGELADLTFANKTLTIFTFQCAMNVPGRETRTHISTARRSNSGESGQTWFKNDEW